MAATTYALLRRREDGELERTPLHTGMSTDQMCDELTAIVDGHGIAALRHYAIGLEPSFGMHWTAEQWWELMVDAPQQKLVRVSAETVVDYLLRNKPGTTAVGQHMWAAAQDNLNTAITLIESLGYVVARKVDGDAKG